MSHCVPLTGTGAISLDTMGQAQANRTEAIAKAADGTGEAILTGAQRAAKDMAARRATRAAAAKTTGEDGVDVQATTAHAVSAALTLVSDEVKNERQKVALERYLQVVGNVPNAGERLVSGSDDFTLIIWAPQEDKKPLQRLTGHQQMINHVCFSPDARFFASASFDKKIKIWDGKTGKFLNTCHGHVGSVYQLAWSADSSFLVSSSKDSTLKLWNAKDTTSLKKAMHTLPGHEDEVYALDWSPDGRCVASGSKDRTIKIWHH